MAPPARGDPGSCGSFLEEERRAVGTLTQLPSEELESRARGRQGSVGGVCGQRIRVLHCAPRSAPPLPGLRKRRGVFQRQPEKLYFLQESRGPARASSKASGAARWKPMLPGRPLRAGRDCESPLLPPGNDSSSSVQIQSLPTPGHQSIQIHEASKAGSPAPPWSHQARVLWSSGWH